ncbi:MAG: methylamine utilization protein [Planctomycetota bacterium]
MKKTLSLLSIAALVLAGCQAKMETTAQAPANLVEAATQVEFTPEAPVESEATSKPHYVSTQAESATLKIKFVLDGKIPEAKNIDGSRDPYCADKEIPNEKMVIGENGEIANLAIYLDTRKTKIDLPEIAVEDKKPVLDNKDCIFVPHVVTARPGQTIIVKNSDETGHNANFSFFNNAAVNFLVPANSQKELELKADEPAPIPVECNVHPWMKAYLIVTEHPFVGVTNAAGELIVKDLPVGEVTFKVWHENAVKSLDEATVGGKKEKWSRGRMEIELKPGVNDLGTVKLSADLFKPVN